MKFGGTSVGIPDAFRVAIRQVLDRREQDPLVVVSALAGVTDLLVDFCAHVEGRQELTSIILARHRDHVAALGMSPEVIAASLAALEADLASLPPRPAAGEARDRVLAHGERLAAAIFAAGLEAQGAAASAHDAGEAGLLTDEHFGAAHPLPESAE